MMCGRSVDRYLILRLSNQEPCKSKTWIINNYACINPLYNAYIIAWKKQLHRLYTGRNFWKWSTRWKTKTLQEKDRKRKKRRRLKFGIYCALENKHWIYGELPVAWELASTHICIVLMTYLTRAQQLGESTVGQFASSTLSVGHGCRE